MALYGHCFGHSGVTLVVGQQSCSLGSVVVTRASARGLGRAPQAVTIGKQPRACRVVVLWSDC